MSKVTDLLRSGDVEQLRAHVSAQVRAEPAKVAHRLALADIFIVADELERADAQLDIASDQDTTIGLPVALTRQLIRAAKARAECFAERRPPELVTEVDEAIASALARLAGIHEPADDHPLSGTIDGRAFEGWRDGDDRTPHVLELLTSTGKYVWVSFAQIASLKPRAPARLRDLVWREAELEIRGGPSGVVYLPAIYQTAAMTDAQRLGRETDWIDRDGQSLGLGLRTWLIGEDAVALGDFAELRVAP